MTKYINSILFSILFIVCSQWHTAAAFSWDLTPAEQAAFSAISSKNRAGLRQSLIKLAQQEPTSYMLYPFGSSFYLYDQEFTDEIVQTLKNYLKIHPNDIQVNCTVGCILLDNSLPPKDALYAKEERWYHEIPPDKSLPTTLHREAVLSGMAYLEHAFNYANNTTMKELVFLTTRNLLRGYSVLDENDKGMATVTQAQARFPGIDPMCLLYYQAKFLKKKSQLDQAYTILKKH
ncbi:MAG: hypothetical protein ACE14V_12125 [bacterium]